MRSIRLLAVLAAAAAFGAPGAAAQDACGGELKAPPVGGWVEYRMTGERGTNSMRMAVIRAESRGGRDMIWLEMSLSGGRDGNMIMQMLVPSFPYEMSGVQEMVMKSGNEPAMRMPAQMLAMIRGQMANNPQVADACRQVTLIGTETITVAGGTFRTQHYRQNDNKGDVWVSRELPFGMVKWSGQGHQMELVGHGGDAKSSITERPMDMPGMR